MDTAIPGTVSFVKALSADGYTIAYLSGRPNSVLAATKTSLQETGFPIDSSLDRDLVFLHSGKGSIPNITKHKKHILTHLKQQYDIHFFLTTRRNSVKRQNHCSFPAFTHQSQHIPEKRNALDKKRSKKTRNNPGPLNNPAPKPRKKRNKSGNTKEPVKKYMDRFMGDAKMNEEFPGGPSALLLASPMPASFTVMLL